MTHALQVYTGPAGTLLADWTYRAQRPEVAYNEHGDLTLTATIPMGREEAFAWYDRAGLPQVELTTRWGERAWQGRLEEVTITERGISITAYGAWQALKDLPYTALWSDTKLDRWRASRLAELSGAFPDRFSCTTQDELRISPQKNSTQGAGVAGYLLYEPPDQGSRPVTEVTFDYALLAPASAGTTWRAELHFRSAAMLALGPSPAWQLLSNSSGVVQAGTIVATYAGAATRLTFRLYNSATQAQYTGETDAVYLKVSNVRVLSSTDNAVSTTLGTTVSNLVNTTLGTSFVAGTRTATPPSMTNIIVGRQLAIGGANPETVTVTAITGTTFTAVFAFGHPNTDTVTAPPGSAVVTPASMAAIYVGQRLGIGGTESVLVTAVTATTFTAVFTLSHANTDAVTAALLYGDSITRDIVAAVVAANPGQLSASTGLIQSQGVDLLQRVYEDKEPGALLTELVALGDTSGQQWEVGVSDPSRAVHLRPRGSGGRVWYVHDATLEITRTLDQLANSVYATYTSATNRTLRTAAATDAFSISRYAVTRQQAVTADTTDATEAAQRRDIALADRATPIPRATIHVQQIFDATGVVWPVWSVRAGDTIALQLLPAVAGASIDRIRTFRIDSVRITASGLEITPETPATQLDSYVLRAAERFTAPTV